MDLRDIERWMDEHDPQPRYSVEEFVVIVGAFAVWFLAVYGARAFWLWMTA